MKTINTEIITKDTSSATLELKDQIIYVRLLEDAELNLNSLREQHRAQEKLTENGKSYTVLVDGTKNVKVTNEARNAMAAYAPKKRKATAIVTNQNLVTRILANFYIKINKPKIPTRLFENESEAIPWLNKFLTN